MSTAAAAALTLDAPAKLNLFLHVLGRRDDGYHDLQTLFTFIDLCDRIELRRREDGRILRLEGPADVSAEEDLCQRAAALLKAATGTSAGAEIRLRKCIPIGGGVGGGSSDAAAVLLGLNRLWDLGWEEAALATLGLELGADVPVFVRGRSAFADGVGERLRAVSLGEQWYVLACPPVHVATATVFGDPALTRDSSPLTIAGFVLAGGSSCAPAGGREPAKALAGDAPDAVDLDALWSASRNDCEAVVRSREPRVDRVLAWFARRAPARMSGTGACVFARVGDEASARRLATSCEQAMVEAEGAHACRWRVMAVRGLDRSPVHGQIAGH